VNILLTHLHLDFPGGSETYTYTVARALLERGHRPTVVSPIVGEVGERLRSAHVPVVDELQKVRGHPDVIHSQHNVLALAARDWFPGAPLVFHSHGTLPLPEQPPSVDLNVQRYVAVSDLVRRHLESRGVPEPLIRILENPVDLRRFAPRSELSARARRALVLSAVMDPGTFEVIREACGRMDIELEVVGLDGTRTWDVERRMQDADVVFSLGRGAIESMASGRAVFVYDRHGADGWVTPETVDDIASHTFSGKRFRRQLTPAELVAELDRYDPAMGPANRRIAEERYDIRAHLDRLEAVYAEAQDAFEPKRLSLPAQEVEVALMALRARLPDPEDPPHVENG
jgi:O-antigen biosynthesis protein